MRRKLVKQGENALTVTLPVKWLRVHNLKVSDEVEITENNNGLMISGIGSSSKSKNLIVELDNKNHIRSLVSSLYKAGYDEIILNFEQTPSLEVINDIINNFTGLEIISQNKKSVIIKSFLNLEEKEIEKLIIKIFQSTKVIIDSLKEGYENINLENLRSIHSNIMKSRDHCLRMIHITKFGGDKSYDYYDLVTQLEKISAAFCYLAEYIKNKKNNPQLLKQLDFNFDKFYHAYLKKELIFTNKIWEENRKSTKETLNIQNISSLMKKEDHLFLVYYYNIMMHYRHLISRLLGIST